MNDLNGDWRAQPVFDRHCFDQLDVQTGGNAAMIAATYLRLLPERRAALLQALDSADQAALARIAHLCKSGAFSIGLRRLGTYCSAAEQAEAGQIDAVVAAAEFDQAAVLLAGLVGG